MPFLLRNDECEKIFWFEVTGLGPGVRAYFTTRRGGVSRGPYASLNLGFSTGDDPLLVWSNRQIICETLGLDPERLQTTRQVHGDRVLVVDEATVSGVVPSVKADAQVTVRPGVALTCLVADCQAVYIFDPVHRVIGLAHAGWRGAAAGIARTCLESMEGCFNTNPADCRVALSPSAGPCCYEVGVEVAGAVREQVPSAEARALTPVSQNRWMLDLSELNMVVLHEAGVKRENITVSGFCTICRQDLFFSHRGSGGLTGRQAAIMMLDTG